MSTDSNSIYKFLEMRRLDLSQEKMTALGFYKPGSTTAAPSFEAVEIDRPKATGRNLLIEVRAISVNPTDLRTRDAKSEEDSSLTIVGRDASGVVVEAGEDCNLFQVGDEVFYAGTSNIPGSLSEVQLVDERIVGKKPKSIGFPEAAALPLTSLTASEAIFERLRVSSEAADNKDKVILIIGAAGGVGSIATQIAKSAGLTVIGTASRKESREWALEHGADHVINHHEAFEPQLAELGIQGVHYIFCLTNIDDHLESMATNILPQGKICSILPAQKPLPPELFLKSVTFVYELMYTRSVFQTEDMISQHFILMQLADWVDSGKIRSTMTKKLSPLNPLTLKEAYENLLTGKTIGKIVIEGPIENIK